jgi:hypothetical protein
MSEQLYDSDKVYSQLFIDFSKIDELIQETGDRTLNKLSEKVGMQFMKLFERDGQFFEEGVGRSGEPSYVESIGTRRNRLEMSSVKKLSPYNKFVKKHMNDKGISHLPVTDRMIKISQMWKEMK